MRHVLSVFVQNQPGVLVRVASMFSRREFNIDSLSVGVTQSPDFSRITVVVHGDEYLVNQMMKLQIMHVSDCNRRIKILTGTSVSSTNLTVASDRNILPELSVLKIISEESHNILVECFFIFIMELRPF